MDPMTMLVLVLFALMVVAWLVLPSTPATAVPVAEPVAAETPLPVAV